MMVEFGLLSLFMLVLQSELLSYDFVFAPCVGQWCMWGSWQCMNSGSRCADVSFMRSRSANEHCLTTRHDCAMWVAVVVRRAFGAGSPNSWLAVAFDCACGLCQQEFGRVVFDDSAQGHQSKGTKMQIKSDKSVARSSIDRGCHMPSP